MLLFFKFSNSIHGEKKWKAVNCKNYGKKETSTFFPVHGVLASKQSYTNNLQRFFGLTASVTLPNLTVGQLKCLHFSLLINDKKPTVNWVVIIARQH